MGLPTVPIRPNRPERYQGQPVRRIIPYMGDEQADIEERMRSSAYCGQQDQSGVDLSLIRENLRLTPTERVRRADRARRDALRVLEYGRRNREERA